MSAKRPPAKQAPAWRRYLRFWGADPGRDLDDEIRFHVDARYEEYRAMGLDPAAVRAEAEKRFGDARAFRDQCAAIDSQWERERSLGDWLRALGADLRYAVRQLRRAPALALAVVLCFALGIGANSAIFSVVDAVLFRPLPFAAPDRLVLVGEGLPRLGPDNFGVISAPEYLDYKTLNGRIFTDCAAYETLPLAISGSGEPVRVSAVKASASLFAVLGVTAERGHLFLPTDDRVDAEVAVISDRLWRTRYAANPSVIGSTVDLDGRPTTVIGVLRAGVQFPIGAAGGDAADVFIPYPMTPAVEQQRAQAYRTWLIARLAPGVTRAAAARAVSDLAASFPQRHDVYRADWPTVAEIFPLRDRAEKDVRKPLLVLLAAVGAVLLIACLNITSLLLARAASRSRELAVRRALGASPGRLVRQFFAESLVLVTLGGALGIAFGAVGTRLLVAVAPADVLRGYDISLDGRVVAATALVVVVTALLFSLVPVVHQGRGGLTSPLADEGRATAGSVPRQRARRLLVVAEVALALVLATTAGLMVRSFVRAREVNPGFDAAKLLTFRLSLPEVRYGDATRILQFERSLLDRLRQLPGVEAASLTSNPPMSEPLRLLFSIENVSLPKLPVAIGEIVMPDYLSAERVPLRAGRYFDAHDDTNAPGVAIVNETLARRYFNGNAIGKRIKWGSPKSPSPWTEIVGVVGDVKASGLDQSSEPGIYFPALQQDTGPVRRALADPGFVVRIAGDPTAWTGAVRAAVRAADPNLPIIELQPMSNVVASSVASRRFNTLILGTFALLALALASLGVYGLIAYAVAQRTREIGVRLAIGATPSSVLRLVVGQGTRLAAVGVVLGLIGALALARVMRSLLFDVSPFDPLAFIGASALLLGIAALASLIPARRAMGIDPQLAMRGE